MKKYTFLSMILFSLVISCTTAYTSISEEIAFGRIYLKEEDQAFLLFCKGYNTINVQIYQNDSLRFDSAITTGKKELKDQYVAGDFRINKKDFISIYFEKDKTPLLITPKQMKQYSSIYFSKKGKKRTLEFNNEYQSFITYSKKKLEISNEQKDSIR